MRSNLDNRKDIAAILRNRNEVPPFHRLSQLEALEESEIRSSGYVVDTLEAALWSLLHSHSYAETVLRAVNLGNDTDTVGAVAGGLAGILYGMEAIPAALAGNVARQRHHRRLSVLTM